MLKSLPLFVHPPSVSSIFLEQQAVVYRNGVRVISRRMSATNSPIIPKFVSVEGADIQSRSKPDGIRFRLVSYNILAQAYVKSSYFPHSPSACLRWKARSKAILTVLENLGADFLCLQELDEYYSFYKAKMEGYGYSSIYIQRSGQKRDGCGIFYKQKCAELLLKESIDYNDLVDTVEGGPTISNDKQSMTLSTGTDGNCPDKGVPSKGTSQVHGDPNDPRVRLKRDCVGIMGAFKLKDPFHHVVIIANTHLYWDPEWADVKLAQAKYLLSRIDQFKMLVADKFECNPSLILAGDFNSTPGDQVYQYLVSGNFASAALMGCWEDLPIPMCSVYATTGGEPQFTNCTPDFTNTLDYIFFAPCDYIKPVRILELPQLESPDVVGCLPNYSHPSDHLPIGADFEISSK